MSQGAFTAPCGCVWHDGQIVASCAAWQDLVAERDRLRRDWNAEYGHLRIVEEQMAEHMPPGLAGQQ